MRSSDPATGRSKVTVTSNASASPDGDDANDAKRSGALRAKLRRRCEGDDEQQMT